MEDLKASIFKCIKNLRLAIPREELINIFNYDNCHDKWPIISYAKRMNLQFFGYYLVKNDDNLQINDDLSDAQKELIMQAHFVLYKLNQQINETIFGDNRRYDQIINRYAEYPMNRAVIDQCKKHNNDNNLFDDIIATITKTKAFKVLQKHRNVLLSRTDMKYILNEIKIIENEYYTNRIWKMKDKKIKIEKEETTVEYRYLLLLLVYFRDMIRNIDEILYYDMIYRNIFTYTNDEIYNTREINSDIHKIYLAGCLPEDWINEDKTKYVLLIKDNDIKIIRTIDFSMTIGQEYGAKMVLKGVVLTKEMTFADIY